jgi:predicted ribosomally synthesized peptide with nif11-like leader
MSEKQLTALLAKLNDDAELREKLKGAADLDAAVAMAQEAGFDVSKADWLRYQAGKILELNDDQLSMVSGGIDPFGLVDTVTSLGSHPATAASPKLSTGSPSVTY